VPGMREAKKAEEVSELCTYLFITLDGCITTHILDGRGRNCSLTI
jgi:hypothetical protein